MIGGGDRARGKDQATRRLSSSSGSPARPQNAGPSAVECQSHDVRCQRIVFRCHSVVEESGAPAGSIPNWSLAREAGSSGARRRAHFQRASSLRALRPLRGAGPSPPAASPESTRGLVPRPLDEGEGRAETRGPRGAAPRRPVWHSTGGTFVSRPRWPGWTRGRSGRSGLEDAGDGAALPLGARDLRAGGERPVAAPAALKPAATSPAARGPRCIARVQGAPVAQMDRASDFESEGRRFDSCRAYQRSRARLRPPLPGEISGPS
jgi:hypothetical protein